MTSELVPALVSIDGGERRGGTDAGPVRLLTTPLAIVIAAMKPDYDGYASAIVGECARQYRFEHLINVGHLSAEPTAVGKVRFTSCRTRP